MPDEKEKNIQYITEIDKPNDWPQNAIECSLSNIEIQLDKFKNNPTYQNKEILISLVSNYDLNQSSHVGLVRTTKYEVALTNKLFLEANVMQFNSLKTYLYELIGIKTRMQKMMSWVTKDNKSINIDEYEGLFLSLKLYYISYQKYTVEKDKKYSEQLVEVVEYLINEYNGENTSEENAEQLIWLESAYISLLNDISYFRCYKRTGIWAFDRDEIYELFILAAKITKINKNSPLVRPLKGVLMTSISNYILKSRNDYNNDYICKYISDDVSKKSIINNEIWMSVIEKLNDDREKKTVPELFDDLKWCSYSWVSNIDFTSPRNYYVSSFCKNTNDSTMKKNYGPCIYGYKDDRLAEMLSPIIHRKHNDFESFCFSQVVAFDVIYDKEEAKKELEFLCKIIDAFDMKSEEKKLFLQEIMQYWILSVKDSKWSYEKERRYIIFLYQEYEYLETDLKDSNFLKLKTSLLTHPDFVLGELPVKNHIKLLIDNKRKSIYSKSYLFCENCLNRDFDNVAIGKNPDKCSICQSSKITIVEP